MARGFASRFREEIDAREVGGAALVVGVLYLLGLEVSAIGVILAIFVLTPLLRAGIEAVGLDIGPSVAALVFSALLAAVGIGELTDGNGWLGVATLAAGGWLCLDAVYLWRRGDRGSGEAVEDEDLSKDEVYRYGEYNRWLIDALREADRPLTRDEIQSRTGLTEADFERLLELHGESGPIERVGNGYTIDESELGAVAFVRTIVRTIGGRILRPFRLFRPAG